MASKFLNYFLIITLLLCSFLHDYFCVEATKKGSQSAVKTIETEDGDIYDCVDFYKQPAFNHPLLKNHSFHPEMRPTSRPKWLTTQKSSAKNQIAMNMKLKDGGCPKGTVPIRRYNNSNNSDLFQNKLFRQHYEQLGAKSVQDQNGDAYHFAVSQSKSGLSNTYYGVAGTLSVYNPQILPSQYSSGEIIIKGNTDAIIVGWTVNPHVYVDSQTRFFIYTIAGDSHCFNSQCGFISVRSDIPLDLPFKPVSKKGGPIYEFQFFVYQDAKNGNWWLEAGADAIILGFWPQRIFRGLYNAGTYVACGGEAFQPSDTPYPAMGNGAYPIGYMKEYNSYCEEMQFVDDQHNVVYADGHTEAYTSDKYHYGATEALKRYFTFGGPDVLKSV